MVQIKKKVTIKQKVEQSDNTDTSDRNDKINSTDNAVSISDFEEKPTNPIQVEETKDKQEPNSVKGKPLKKSDSKGLKIAAFVVGILAIGGVTYYALNSNSVNIKNGQKDTVAVSDVGVDSSNSMANGDSTNTIDPVAMDTAISQSTETVVESSSTNPEDIKTVGSTTSTALTNVEQMANRVLDGEFGNGNVRKRKLGKSYSTIQAKVNEMYRNGLVH